MKKSLLLITTILLTLVFTISAFAGEKENTEYIFWDKEPYTEDETTKIIDHVVYKLCNYYQQEEYHYDVYDWFDTQEAANTVEEINIVSEIDGIKVTHVNCWVDPFDWESEYSDHRYWTNHNYTVKKITFPDTIESIGLNCLSIFESVEELQLPTASGTCENMESLREVTYTKPISYLSGFMNCTKLEKINYTGEIKAIGTEAFRNCISLTDFEIPQTVETIYDAAFRGSGITTATIPANAYLRDYDYGCTFKDCKNLTEVTFGGEYDKSLVAVYFCFEGCTSLKKITFPKSVKNLYLDPEAFLGCSSLEEIVFPETCGSLFLDWYAFKNCTSIKKIVLPDDCGRIDIGREAFKGCTALEEIVSPYTCGNVAIRKEAFRNCTSLTELKFPQYYCGTVTIYDDAFRGCTALKAITFTTPVSPNYIEEVFPGNIIIGYRAFRDCTALTTIKNTANVEKIYGGAFRGCTSLTSFNLSDKIEFIGKNAFYGCKSLKYLNLKATKNSPKVYSDAFKGTASNIQFTTFSKSTAQKLKTSLIKSGLKNPNVRAKVYV